MQIATKPADIWFMKHLRHRIHLSQQQHPIFVDINQLPQNHSQTHNRPTCWRQPLH